MNRDNMTGADELLLRENRELRQRLAEAEETLNAIREGEVDAVIVSGKKGDQVFSLMETENLHKLMVETMNEAGMALSTEGMILYCNNQTSALLNIPRERILGKNIGSLVADADRDRCADLLKTAQERRHDDKIRLIDANGEQIPMHIWASPLDHYDGTMICLVGTDMRRIEWYRDLIERLEEQKRELHDSRLAALNLMDDAHAAHRQAVNDRNRLQAVMKSLPVGVAIVDERGGNIQSNPMFENIWGGPRPETQSLEDYGQYRAWWAETGDPVETHQWASAQAVLEGETVMGQLIKIKGFNDREAYVINSAAPIYDHDGKITGSAVAIMDITRLWNVELELKRSVDRFELLALTAQELLRSPDPQRIIESLCRKVMDYLDCQAFFNFIVDEQAGKLHLNACAGIPEEEARAIEWLEYGQAVCGCAARDRCRIVAEHIPSSEDERTSLVKSYGIKAYACHPLIGENGHLIGTLSFGTRERETFSEDDLAFMKAVADQVAVAMTRLQNEEKLRRNEAMLQGILDATRESIWLFSADGIILKANSTALLRLGKPADEVIGRYYGDFMVPSITHERMALLKRVVDTGLSSDFEDERGSYAFHHTFYPVLEDTGNVTSVVTYSRDITERKRSEKELKRLNRTLRALSKSSQATVRSTSEDEYLHNVCRIIVEDCGHIMAWVGFAENDEDKTVRAVAQYGHDDGYIDTLNITWADTERGRGPTGTAIRSGKPSFCKNMFTDPQFTPWREEALQRGYASSIVLPLKADNAVFGALTIYSTEPDPFVAEEVQLLTNLADDLSQGITTFRLKMANERATELLRQSEERHRTLFETISHGVVYQDADGVITDANPAAQRILGLSLSQMQGHRSIDPLWKAIHEDGSIYPGEDHPSMRALKTGSVIHNITMGIFNPEKKEYTWININAIPLIRPREETPHQVYTIFEDITERRKAEMSIKRLATFPELNPNPIIEVSIEGNVQYFNAAARNIFPGLQLQGLSHPFLADVTAETRQFIENGRDFTVRDIKVGQSTYQQYLHYLQDQRCIRIYGFDISMRKKMEEALKDSERRFRALFEYMTEGVIVHEMLYDTDGAPIDYIIISANPAIEKHTGIRNIDAIGKTATTLYNTPEAPYLDVYSKVLSSGESARFDTYFPPMEKYFSISAFTISPNRFATVFEDITGRILAEEEMRQTLTATTEGIWKRNVRTGEVFYSPRYYTMLGYEPDEFPASLDSWKSLIHPDDFNQAMKVHEKFEQGHIDLYINEFRMRAKDGTYRYIRSRGRVISRDENDRPLRVIGNHDDITVEKTAEKMLAETNALLTTIVDNTDMLIAYLDNDFNFLRVNRSYAAAGRKDISFFPGKNHFMINPSKDLLDIFLAVVRTGTPHFEKGKSYIYPSSSERTASFWDLSIIPIMDHTGKVMSLVLTLADVTNYKMQEASLLEFNEKLDMMVHERTEALNKTNESLKEEIARGTQLENEKEKAYAELDTIFNSMSVGMTVINRECQYIRVNRRFSEMVSIDTSEIVGKRCSELWNSPICGSDTCPMKKILSGQSDFMLEYEMKYVNPAGRELIFQITIVPYYWDNGVIGGIISNAIDITEKREIQLKLTSIIDEERKNISFELHDDLGQNLTAMGFILESIRQKINSPRRLIMEKIDEISELLQTAQNKTRSLSKLLSPVEMGRDGLPSSLESMAVSIERIYGIKCKLKIDQGFIVEDNNTATTLYYIAREAATNAVKHGKPKTIFIHAFNEDKSLGIAVRDNGRGLAGKVHETGIGIKIMKYRAQMIGATLTAGKNKERGFEVIVRLTG